MKKLVSIICVLLILFTGCNSEATYYDELVENKSISERIVELNKSLTQIRKSESKKALIKEEYDYLKYEYKIGKDETYTVTYFFDDIGCWEVALDTYFNEEIDAQLALDKIKEELDNVEELGLAKNTNDLYQWSNKEGLVSVELDYTNVDKGMISLTAFAYE